MNDLHALSPRKLLVLCLLFLVPGVSFAAEESGQVPAPIPGMQDSSRDPWEEDEATPSHGRGLRIAMEAGTGLMTSLTLGLGGGVASMAICEEFKLDNHGLFPCLGALIYGTFGGIALGLPLGVWGGGEVLDGNGSLLATLAGSVAGLLVSVGLASLLHDWNDGTVVLLSLGPALVGPIVGYELTQRERPVPKVSSRSRLQPTLAFSSRGAVLGLGGCF